MDCDSRSEITDQEFIDTLDIAGVKSDTKAFKQTTTISSSRPTADLGTDYDSSLHFPSRTSETYIPEIYIRQKWFRLTSMKKTTERSTACS